MRNHVVYSFFPKAVATEFTNVHDLNLKQISLISIVIFRFLKKSLEVQGIPASHGFSSHGFTPHGFFRASEAGV